MIERRKSDRWGFALRAKAAGWRSGGCGHLVGNLGNTANDIQSQFVFMNQKNISMSETWRDSSCASRVYVPSPHPSGTFKAAF